MNGQDIPYYLPRNTRNAVRKHIDRCKNISLILHKYVECAVIEDTSQKGAWLRELTQADAMDSELARNAYVRWLATMKLLQVTPFDVTLDWRMIVGLGGDTVLETDMTLHPLYGIPIIPGSALKGLTRAYVAGEKKAYFVPPLNKPAAALQPSREETTDHPDIQRIFGMQEHAGTVVFFDALPQNGKATLVVDIMNPHYPDYYDSLQKSKIKDPANTQSPRPITFLAVQHTTFTFALAPRDPNNSQHVNDVKLAEGWLLEALQNYGAGGKTSAGYGYFHPPVGLQSSQETAPAAEPTTHPANRNDTSSTPQVPVIDPDVKTAEGYIRELEALRDVAGQIQGYYQKWKQFNSQEARLWLGKAIVEKVRKAGRERVTAEKAWYKELQAFLQSVKGESE